MTEVKTTDDFIKLCQEALKPRPQEEYIYYVGDEEQAELVRKHTGHKVIVISSIKIEPFTKLTYHVTRN